MVGTLHKAGALTLALALVVTPEDPRDGVRDFLKAAAHRRRTRKSNLRVERESGQLLSSTIRRATKPAQIPDR